ncbi:hypothetical protein ES703_98181 [subsurface metagenome]
MAKKSVSWSKSENEEKIDKSKKENPSQEKNMDEKQVLDLLDKRDQKLLDRVNKKYGGNTPPGGDKMDQELRDYFSKIDKIGQSVENQGKILENQGKMLEGVFGERKRKEGSGNIYETAGKKIMETMLTRFITQQTGGGGTGGGGNWLEQWKTFLAMQNAVAGGFFNSLKLAGKGQAETIMTNVFRQPQSPEIPPTASPSSEDHIT